MTLTLPIRPVLLSLLAGLTCSALPVPSAAQSAPAQSAVGWGYSASPDSAKQAELKKQRGLALLANATPLTPETTTDFELPDVSFAYDASFGRALRISTPMKSSQQPFFWVVDPGHGTYQLFRLTNPDADVRRIEAFLRAKGTTVSLDTLRSHLTNMQARSNALRLQPASRRFNNSRLSNPRRNGRARTADFETFFCTGGIDAGITAYDPLLINLTDTLSWAHWTRDDYGIISADVGGQCFANPNTGFSTWFLDSCNGSVTWDFGWPYLDVSTTGDYHNDDFGDPNERTFVFQQAAVNFSGGILSYSTFHFDDGEFSLLIFGSTYVPAFYEDCFPID